VVVVVDEVLILEGVPEDAFSTGAISIGDIAALDHKPFDDTVETISFIVEVVAAMALSFFPGAKAFKILRCSRDISKKRKHNLPHINPIS